MPFVELVKNTFGINMYSKLNLPDNFIQCGKIVKNLEVSILKISFNSKYTLSGKNN